MTTLFVCLSRQPLSRLPALPSCLVCLSHYPVLSASPVTLSRLPVPPPCRLPGPPPCLVCLFRHPVSSACPAPPPCLVCLPRFPIHSFIHISGFPLPSPALSCLPVLSAFLVCPSCVLSVVPPAYPTAWARTACLFPCFPPNYPQIKYRDWSLLLLRLCCKAFWHNSCSKQGIG